MAPRVCVKCKSARPSIKRPKTHEPLCQSCFFSAFENEIHYTIMHERLFSRGERVAIGASGGKDSTVLAYVLKLLNERHDYGLDLHLLSVDEGIHGYRDDSLATVQRNQVQYGLPLQIVSFQDLYGWTMDEVVRKIGKKGNCTYCGVFRRQALDRGAALILKADKVVTGHNADDIAETVLMNMLRGDFPRLLRCTDVITGRSSKMPRVKPFKYTYEKEIVLYAYFKKLDYFATECKYSPEAFRGYARQYIKDIEAVRPRAILDIIYAAENLTSSSIEFVQSNRKKHGDPSVSTANANDKSQALKLPIIGVCRNCGYISSQELCKACVLLQILNK